MDAATTSSEDDERWASSLASMAREASASTPALFMDVTAHGRRTHWRTYVCRNDFVDGPSVKVGADDAAIEPPPHDTYCDYLVGDLSPAWITLKEDEKQRHMNDATERRRRKTTVPKFALKVAPPPPSSYGVRAH